MKPSLTLCIKDFGNIKEAEIDIAPMMLFIGHNNTGKSYVAMLWWGILDALKDFDAHEQRKFETSEHFKYIKEWFFKQKHGKLKLEVDLLNHIISILNLYLEKEKGNILKQIFNSNDISIGQLEVKLASSCSVPEIEWKIDNNYTQYSTSSLQKIFGKDNHQYRTVIFSAQFPRKDEKSLALMYASQPSQRKGINTFNFTTSLNIKDEEISRIIVPSLIKDIINLTILNNRESHYLPASRSGYMLTYKPLTAEAHKRAWSLSELASNTAFTKPIVVFLQNLATAEFKKRQSPSIQNICNYLEDNILKGHIVEKKQPTLNDYLFQPTGIDKLLPFHITSSLVSELAPLIIFLRSHKIFSLIMEEPEAHLHPEMQYLLVRNLVKLFNGGVPTLLTTHSISIFEQLNNLITLFNHPKQKEMLEKFGYTKEELLNPDDVLIYQFEESLEGTKISKLELTETGFIAPTFNKSISDLSKQSLILSEGEVKEVIF